MSRRSRRERRGAQEAQSAPQAAPTVKSGPAPIKVLAVGIGVLILLFAAVNLLVGSAASSGIGSNSGSTTRTAGNQQPLAGSLAPVNNGVQEVALSMQGYTYQPQPIRVKVGVPVKMTVDLSTVRGCMRSIQIPELGVSGRVSDGNNVITFTPTKAGTFRMTCSMGMADGTIIVEDENGQAPAAVPSAKVAPIGGGGSCGSGGCGCGG